MYFSCIYSVLTYCLCIWGGVLQCTERGQRIIKLHARAVKNLFSEFCHPDVCIFKDMKLLKLKDIHKLYVGVYMFKVIKLNKCPTLQVNLDLKYPQHDYFTRTYDNPIVSFPRVTSLRINFKYQCSKIWNDIPENIKPIIKRPSGLEKARPKYTSSTLKEIRQEVDAPIAKNLLQINNVNCKRV